MNETAITIIGAIFLALLGLLGDIFGYAVNHWLSLLTFGLLIYLIILLTNRIRSLEIKVNSINEHGSYDEIQDRTKKTADLQFNSSLKKEPRHQKLNDGEMSERYAKEFIGKVSYSFDGNNDCIGYEFINELSPSHTAIKYMSNEGKLKQIKHIFDNAPYDCKTDEDFSDYMNSVRSKAEIYNFNYISESKSKRIDLRSSIEEAKFYRKNGL